MIKLLKQDLLIFLISLVLFSSCKNPELIGLEVQPGEDKLNALVTDTFFIRSHTVRDDSVITSNLIRNLLGEFQDPVLGLAKANIAFQALLSNNSPDFGASPTLDSVVLVLKYAGFYGDSLSDFVVNVHKLTEKLDDDTTYYSNKVPVYDNTTVLGTKTFKARPNDEVLITDIRPDKLDTTIKVDPQLRIKLNSAFGDSLLQNQAKMTDNETFLNYLNGIYLTVTRQSGDGGIMYFDMRSSTASGMVLYYKTGSDTTNFKFLLNSNSAGFNQYIHDYTGTPVGAQLTDTTLGQNLVYVQPMAGLSAKVRIPHLNRMTDSGMISVNKAELILPLESGSNNTYAAPSSIRLSIRTADNKISEVARASLNSGLNQYKIDISGFLQSLLINPDEYKEFIISPVNKEVIANRAIIKGVDHPLSGMKLRLIYTKLY